MGLTEAISTGFRKYVDFSDRAPRSEYWYWTLFVVVVSTSASIIDVVLFPGLEYSPDFPASPLNSLWTLATLIPSISIGVRRLHDLDRTAWWLLIFLTLIGIFVLLVWFCLRGTQGPNRFGPDPLAGRAP